MEKHKNSFEKKKNFVSFGNIKRHFAHVKQTRKGTKKSHFNFHTLRKKPDSQQFFTTSFPIYSTE